MTLYRVRFARFSSVVWCLNLFNARAPVTCLPFPSMQENRETGMESVIEEVACFKYVSLYSSISSLKMEYLS